ncbi:MAG: hypothetical protein RLZZ187_1027 [Pseudomonadota bacterium]|jgi:hypothetical protein
MSEPTRPPNQRWIKRPPRPSRAKPPVARRQAPGMGALLIAIGFGVCAGLLGAVVGPKLLPDQPGMAGLFAGLGLAIGFMAFWKGMGGTREDIRNLFR